MGWALRRTTHISGLIYLDQPKAKRNQALQQRNGWCRLQPRHVPRAGDQGSDLLRTCLAPTDPPSLSRISASQLRSLVTVARGRALLGSRLACGIPARLACGLQFVVDLLHDAGFAFLALAAAVGVEASAGGGGGGDLLVMRLHCCQYVREHILK